MADLDNNCPECGDQMWSIAAYEHHMKTEHSKIVRGHVHKFVVPVEWDTLQGVGGNERMQSSSVTILRCACGAEEDR